MTQIFVVTVLYFVGFELVSLLRLDQQPVGLTKADLYIYGTAFLVLVLGGQGLHILRTGAQVDDDGSIYARV